MREKIQDSDSKPGVQKFGVLTTWSRRFMLGLVSVGLFFIAINLKHFISNYMNCIDVEKERQNKEQEYQVLFVFFVNTIMC